EIAARPAGSIGREAVNWNDAVARLDKLSRSTAPLLAYWQDPQIRLTNLAAALSAPDLENAIQNFEYPVPSSGGKASFTDLMLTTNTTMVAIEGKWREPMDESVSA